MILAKREEAPKALKLLVAIVAVFGCAAWRIAGASAEVPPAVAAGPSPAPVAATTSAPIASTPTVPGALVGGEVTIEVPEPIVLASVDPFRPLRGTPSTPPPVAALAPLPSPQVSSPQAPSPLVGEIAPLPPVVPSGAVGVPVVDAAPRPVPMRLTGIVSGPQATAVLWVGGEESVVRVGSRLPDGSTVVRIDATSLVLRLGSRKTTLSIEG